MGNGTSSAKDVVACPVSPKRGSSSLGEDVCNPASRTEQGPVVETRLQPSQQGWIQAGGRQSHRTLQEATEVLPQESWKVLDPTTALQVLLQGNQRFVSGRVMHPHQSHERIHTIAGGQHPFAALLGCADSRAPAEIIFDQGFGDMFVCRVAGNIATAEQVASLEYAVMELKVKLVVVLGHRGCGAVKAAMSGIAPCSTKKRRYQVASHWASICEVFLAHTIMYLTLSTFQLC